MGIDVPDVFRLDARSLEGEPKRPLLLSAVGLGASGVEGVGRDRGSCQHGEDPGPSCCCMRHRLEDEDAGAFAEHEAIAVRGEGARSRCGLVVAGRQGAHGCEGGRRHRVQCRVGPAGHNDVGASQRNEVCAVGDGLRT